jgi:hypothetical protein
MTLEGPGPLSCAATRWVSLPRVADLHTCAALWLRARGHATTGSGTRESRSECGLGIPETFPHEPVSDRGSSPAATQLQQQKSHSPGAADLAMPGGECTVAEEAAPSSAERHCIVIGPPSTATCELQRRRAHNNPRIRDIAQAGVRSS